MRLTLSLGLLSHTIIPPCKYAELVDHLKSTLIEHFKEYELAMIEIYKYSNIPSESCSNTVDMIVLQIPIYIKHYQQQTLTLEFCSLSTVPVPYHANRKFPEEKHFYL